MSAITTSFLHPLVSFVTLCQTIASSVLQSWIHFSTQSCSFHSPCPARNRHNREHLMVKLRICLLFSSPSLSLSLLLRTKSINVHFLSLVLAASVSPKDDLKGDAATFTSPADHFPLPQAAHCHLHSLLFSALCAHHVNDEYFMPMSKVCPCLFLLCLCFLSSISNTWQAFAL